MKHSIIGLVVTLVMVGGSVMTMLWESLLVGFMLLFFFIIFALLAKVIVDVYNRVNFITTALTIISTAINTKIVSDEEHKEIIN